MTDGAASIASDTAEASISGQAAALELSQGVTELRQEGGHRYDPIRFQFIESLLQRALGQRASVVTLLEEKAQQALAQYQQDFSQAKEHAEAQLALVAEHFPGSVDLVRELFESGDFKAVKRMESSLKREVNAQQRGQSLSVLARLAKQHQRSSFEHTGSQSEHSFSELMRQQEQQVLESSSVSPSPSITALRAATNSKQVGLFDNDYAAEGAGELTSVRQFRESLVKINSDKLVTRVISEAPENPGPLNPQALVIRYLASMRELSPDYLNRFVSYVDTLLWLEQAGDKLKSKKRKKSSRKPRAKKKPASGGGEPPLATPI